MEIFRRIETSFANQNRVRYLTPASQEKAEARFVEPHRPPPPVKASLAALPTELVADIARNVSDLRSFALSSWRHFHVSADIWVQQCGEGDALRRACSALRCISKRRGCEELARRFCAYVPAQIVRDIEN
jgi:hypothetical protein